MEAFAFDQLAPPAPLAPVVVEDPVPAIDVEAIRAEARATGLAEGRAEALAAVAPAVAAIDEAARQVQAGAEWLADQLEEQAVELALAIAEKVLAGTLAAEPERVTEAVRGALRGITERSRVTVFVNPDDLELVRGAADSLAAALGGIEHLEVQAERRVGRGGAIVRHPEGDVDATVATKLERVRELVEAAR